MTQEDILIYKKRQKDPFIFIYDMWWLKPVPKWEECIKWKHISEQQTEIVQYIYEEIQKTWNFKINMTVKSWHSIWKSTILAMLLLWFMTCYRWKIWLTAPDSVSLYDVLWAEIWTWLWKMPDAIKDLFDKTSDHLYVKEDRDWWFARCKTWKKENPEALAWLHSDSMMIICDEASWVPDAIMDTARTNLTAVRYIFILIWNPLRNVWYFRDSFKWNTWEKFSFSTLDSPFQWDLPWQIEKKHWIESDEYRRRILWLFPREDILDNKWYVQLVMKNDIKYVYSDESLYWNRKILWVDCAWEWKDKTTWVLRDNQKAVIIWYESVSDPKSIATKTLTLMRELWVKWEDIIIDNFWAWANVWMELAIMWVKTSPIYVWERKNQIHKWQKCLNLRAKLFWQLKEWLEAWWTLSYRAYWEELLSIRYRRTPRDEVQIMSKEDMRKAWYESPDFVDALSMTFYKDLNVVEMKQKVTNKNVDSYS